MNSCNHIWNACETGTSFILYCNICGKESERVDK